MKENLHEVLRVVDGDTFGIARKREEVVIVQILNMSVPDRGECYYSETKKTLTDLLKNKKVKLEKDVSGVDSYGRFLRHVYLLSRTEDDDNAIVAKFMIENDWAQALSVLSDVKYKTYLARFGTEAKAEKLGVWSRCKGKLPKNFAETTNAQLKDADCVIKGNVFKNNGERVYFLPECPSYFQTRINPYKGERYFCTEVEAKSAGFKISSGCTTIFRKK